MRKIGIRKKGNMGLALIAIAITAVMLMASTSVMAGKGGKPGKPNGDEGGVDPDEYITEGRFDDSTIIWGTSSRVKGNFVYSLKAYDLGPNGIYGDDDDGPTTTLSDPSSGYRSGMDIQGDHVVWVERGSTSNDLYYWKFDSTKVISSTNGELAALETDETMNEGEPNIWGNNVVFRAYPVEYDTTPPPFTYYIRNFDDTSAVKLEGVAYAVLWGNYLTIQLTNGDNSLVDLGTNEKFDGFSTDVPTKISGLSGWTLKLFEFGCAIYYQKDETAGTYDWKYIKVDPSGDVDGPYDLWSDTEWRGYMGTNGDVIAYQKSAKKKKFLVFDIVIHYLDGTTPEQITDEPKYSSWINDIDMSRLFYIKGGQMYFYYFDTGTHEQLS